MLVKNPTKYTDKRPTNVRLEKEIKEKLLLMAKEQGKTLSDLINEMLKNEINKGV